MCEPLVWNHIAHIGKEQLGIFTFTIVATLATDLLWGIIAGTVAKFALSTYFFRKAIQVSDIAENKRPTIFQGIYDFFANPVWRREMVDGNYHMYFNKPMVSFNSMHVCEEFDHVPKEAEAVTIHLDEYVALIDHTSCEHLLATVEEFARNGFPARVDGLDALQPMSDYHASVRVARASENLVPAI